MGSHHWNSAAPLSLFSPSVLLREGQRKECTDNGHDFFREVDRHFHPMHPSVCPQRAFLDRQRNFRWSFTNTFGWQCRAEYYQKSRFLNEVLLQQVSLSEI